eukprot:1659693-Prymnesium_polylepis.1
MAGLGEDYYCDSALRGGSTCTVGRYDGSGCNSLPECNSRNCSKAYFTTAQYYGQGRGSPMFSNTSAGFLCKGPRYAMPVDFEGRDFGSFQHNVDGWANDPVEVRIMAGQPAGSTDEQGLSNEDVGVASMTIEVYGCKLEDEPSCGNGRIEYPEECDLGPENGFGRACSIACTNKNFPACSLTGDCYIPPAAEPTGQAFPGLEEVGARTLPAWIKIANVDFHELFSATTGNASTNDEQCVNCLPPPTISSCPGNLKKYLHSTTFRYLCASPMREGQLAVQPKSFYVTLPRNSKAVGFRGRINAVSKGALDSFLNVSWLPADFTLSNKPSNLQHLGIYRDNFTILEGENTGTFYPNVRDDSIEGRYVDGMSLSIGPAGNRQHVFTLAIGSTVSVPPASTIRRSNFSAEGRPPLSALQDAAVCHYGSGAALQGPAYCYLGNCPCHTSE